MDPREKREDESWAEYGARMATMGIAPTESFAGPTVNKLKPVGSDYTPKQLSTPIKDLQQQNIPQNVLPITPTGDVNLAGMSFGGVVPAITEAIAGDMPAHIERSGVIERLAQGSSPALTAEEADQWKGWDLQQEIMNNARFPAVGAGLAQGLPVVQTLDQIYDSGLSWDAIKSGWKAGMDNLTPNVPERFEAFNRLLQDDAMTNLGAGYLDTSASDINAQVDTFADFGYPSFGQTPSLAGTQTGMPVAMDAGGAVPAQVGDWTQGGVHHSGGYELGPAVDSRFMNNEGVLTGGVPAVDYSQMAQDWSDPTMMSPPAAPTGVWDLSDPTGGMVDADVAAGMLDVGPTSVASRNAPIGMFVNRQHPWAGEQSTGLPSPRVINRYAPVRPTDPLSIHPLNPLVTAPTLGYGIPISTFLAQHTGEGPQPGDRDYGMAGGGVGPTMGGHPGIGPGGGYDLSALPDFATIDARTKAKIDADVAAGMFDVNEFSQASTLGDLYSSGVSMIDESSMIPNNPISVLDKVLSRTPALNFETIRNLPSKVVPKILDTVIPTAKAAPAPVAAPAQPAGPSPADIARMAQAAAARQAQAQAAAQQATKDRVRQAKALMNSRAYNEGGMGSLTAAERDIVAAARVDTFTEMGAEGPMSAAERNVAGGMEFGGAGGMRGSDRGGGGRGGPGGRGR